MAVYEGKWKCTYCGQMNLGRDVTCVQCGQTRGKDVKFILDNDTSEVKDDNLVGLAKGGADWTCSFCSTNNRGSETKCHQCGAERGSSASLLTKKVGASPADGKAMTPSAPARKRNLPLLIGGIAAGVVAIGVLVYFLFFSTSAHMAVLEKGSWERVIPIEENQWVTRTDWEDRVPATAVVLDRWQEKYGTEKVQTGTERRKTGTEDKGNGFFEDVYEDVPVYTEKDVYKTKVKFRVREWVIVQTLKKTGELGSPPEWPAVVLAASQREGRRTETGMLLFKGEDKQYQYAVSIPDLGKYRTGAKYTIWVTPLGAIKQVEAE
jgi:hypothetical protein